jgi:hypothetical protein
VEPLGDVNSVVQFLRRSPSERCAWLLQPRSWQRTALMATSRTAEHVEVMLDKLRGLNIFTNVPLEVRL